VLGQRFLFILRPIAPPLIGSSSLIFERIRLQRPELPATRIVQGSPPRCGPGSCSEPPSASTTQKSGLMHLRMCLVPLGARCPARARRTLSLKASRSKTGLCGHNGAPDFFGHHKRGTTASAMAGIATNNRFARASLITAAEPATQSLSCTSVLTIPTAAIASA
jgi:hypothetical protein